jgi:tRNA-dihydrouridine synthase 1
VLEKLLSKGIIDQKESVGKCLILLKDYKGSTDKKRKITLVTKENNQNESEEFDERKTKKKKKKKTRAKVLNDSSPNRYSTSNTESDGVDAIQQPTQLPLSCPVDYRYILAPMVGASELPFRLLCRKYGATLAYTPMMCSKQFARDEAYRKKEFQTIPEDRPLVVHFSANDPNDFAASAKIVQHLCDAIDLNLGCPQRTAYLGHFGSYLLDPKDRKLIVSIVRRAREEVSIPIFCKIRLLDTIDDTIQLCRDLAAAGASLIAIHARYRATWDRKGPGARDGPALLDQVKLVKQALSDIPIISNVRF